MTDLNSSSVSATLGTDYSISDGMITLSVQTTINVTIDIVNDVIWEGDETLVVKIFNASADTTIGINQTEIRILDDDREYRYNSPTTIMII